jgi:prevent-host-death family protein
MDKVVPISEVRNRLPQIVNKIIATNERYIITRGGKPAAILISPEELETLEILADEELIDSLIRAEEDVRAGRLSSHKEIFSDV